MAGYSDTPLAQKLGIKPGSHLVLLAAPEGFLDATLDALPDGVSVRTQARRPIDVLLWFATNARELDRHFPQLAASMEPDGGMWIAWPKRASGVTTDLNENLVREIGLAAGLVDNKVCAIDDTWSGLRFVYRLTDRPARTNADKRQPGKRAIGGGSAGA